MRVILLFLLLHYSNHGFNQSEKPNNTIQNYAQEVANLESLSMAPFSFYVQDMDTKVVVADINGKMSIPAASTMKLVTTAAALKILGSKYKFKTKLAHSGYIDSVSGTLYGDLFIIGGGDPTLGSKYFSKSGEEDQFLYQWADTLKALGIQKIEGAVIADGSIYKYQGVPNGWVWGDLGNY